MNTLENNDTGTSFQQMTLHARLDYREDRHHMDTVTVEEYIQDAGYLIKEARGQLTSFLRSLLSLCRCHLMKACGERA